MFLKGKIFETTHFHWILLRKAVLFSPLIKMLNYVFWLCHWPSGAALHALSHRKITKADVGFKGTQLKLTLELEGGQRVIFKPQWYSIARFISVFTDHCNILGLRGTTSSLDGHMTEPIDTMPKWWASISAASWTIGECHWSLDVKWI
jgi:hypothetical protein